MKKAFVFDFDDTLAVTTSRVYVFRERGFEAIESHKFASYESSDADLDMDFSEFQDADKSRPHIQYAKPCEMIDFALEMQSYGHSVYVLTARCAESAPDIADFLGKYGLKPKHIEGVGVNANGETGSAKPKRRFLESLTGKYDEITFYDDDLKNINMAKQLGIECIWVE